MEPIRSEEDLDAAIKIIDLYLDRECLTPEEKDYLNALSDRVAEYEEKFPPFKKENP